MAISWSRHGLTAVRFAVTVGKGAVPAVTGSESISVVVTADKVLGAAPVVWTNRSSSPCRNGGPQYGEPGPKITRVYPTVVGSTAPGVACVRCLVAT